MVFHPPPLRNHGWYRPCLFCTFIELFGCLSYLQTRFWLTFILFLVMECIPLWSVWEKRVFPASPHLVFTSPPILLCETSKGNYWVKTAKKDTLKSKTFGRKSFGKTTSDKKLSNTFSGISDKKTFGQTRHQRTSMITNIC